MFEVYDNKLCDWTKVQLCKLMVERSVTVALQCGHVHTAEYILHSLLTLAYISHHKLLVVALQVML